MKRKNEELFIPLEQETRTAVNTAAAAHHLCRQQQTLRSWACFENGPIRPIRINGRLAWSVRELRRMLGCSPFSKPTERQDASLVGASANRRGEQA